MKKTVNLLLITLILFAQVYVSYLILKRNEVPRLFDEYARVEKFFVLRYGLIDKDNLPLFARIKEHLLTLDTAQAHPHFYELVGAVSRKILRTLGIFGIDEAILLADGFFLAMLLFSIYGLGCLILSPGAGLLAAAMISCFPLVFAHSRVAMLDFPLMCMLTLTFYLLLRTQGLRSLTFSILTGIFLGLAQHTKEGAIFFALPVLAYFFISCLKNPANRKRVLLNISVVTVLFLIIAGSLFFRKENSFVFAIALQRTLYQNNFFDPFFYFNHLVDIIGPLMLVFALPLAASYLFNLRQRNKLLFLWFFLPLAFLSFLHNREARFLLPALPALALIVSCEISSSDILKKARSIAAWLLACLCLAQYGLFNLGLTSYVLLGRGSWHPSQVGVLNAKNKYKNSGLAGKVLEALKRNPLTDKKTGKITFICNIDGAEYALNLKLHQTEIGLYARNPLGVDSIGYVYDKRDMEKTIRDSDYVIDMPKEHKKPKPHMLRRLEALDAVFAKQKDKFTKIAEIHTDDGIPVSIYKRDSP